MRIAIIGAGNVGAALARGWSRAGHEVVLGVRDAAKHRALIEETGARALPPNGAAEAAEVIVVAVPHAAVFDAVAGLGALEGKVVIDATNAIAQGPDGPDLAVGFTTSAAEQIAERLPGARVVKTLNQVGAGVMADAGGFDPTPVMFMAGDDAVAKETVAGLLSDIGFEAVDAGPLHRARLLEPLAMLWIDQALVRGRGRDWAFAVTRRRG